MHMIAAFVAKVGATIAGSSAAAGTAAATTAATTTAATTAAGTAAAGATAAKGLTLGKVLGSLAFAGSAVGALGQYALMRQQALAMDAEAFDEELQSRQEFIQATQRQAAATREFNRIVGEQLVLAPALGVDIGSGSVQEARRAAQAEADRQVSITREGSAMNAALRRARASILRGNATTTREAAPLVAAGQMAVAGEGLTKVFR